jgi:hypothetical protein
MRDASWNWTDAGWWDGFGPDPGAGLDGAVFDFVEYQGKLIAVGRFRHGSGQALNGIAAWDGVSWSPLGLGLQSGGAPGDGDCLAVYDGRLVVGGIFDAAGGIPVNNIAQWDGTQWSPLGAGLERSVDTVHCLAVYQDHLIAGGAITGSGGTAISRIAWWDGTNWLQLGDGITDGDGRVLAAAVYHDQLIVGGYIHQSGSATFNHLAKWDGTAWSALDPQGTDDIVQALQVIDGRLLVGGSFSNAGGLPALHVASWDGTVLGPMGSGLGEAGISHAVMSLVSYKGHAYASGLFNTGTPAKNNIAAWDGTDWQPLGSGLSERSYALYVYGGSLYVGGRMETAGGKPSVSIARWTRTLLGPPDCSHAVVSEAVLWPPNHSYHAISIQGVTDPENDPVTITVTAITQDEPVNGRGDGRTCPDAQIVNGVAFVRAEREGTPGRPGNGRVYAISFTADDGQGGTCTGIVNTCVPHDLGHPTCTDDGQRYNSLGPCSAGKALAPEVLSLSAPRLSGSQAQVDLGVPMETPVSVSVHDVTGRRLATLESGVLSAGTYTRTWNMNSVPKGLYFLRMQAGPTILTQRVFKLY